MDGHRLPREDGSGEQLRLDGVLVRGREHDGLGVRVRRRIPSRRDVDPGLDVAGDVERDRNLDPAVRPDDVHALMRLDTRRTRELRLSAVGELEHRRREHIDAHLRIAMHEGFHRMRFLVEEEAGQVDAVAPDVHGGAAAVLHAVADVPGIGVVVAEDALDQPEPSDGAAADEPHGLDPGRVVAVHEGLLEGDPGVRTRLDHVPGLLGGHRQRLLAQDVLPRLGRVIRPLGVEIVRERDVDGIHIVRGEELLVRPIGVRDPEFIGRLPRPVPRPRGDRNDLAVRGRLDRRGHRLHTDVRRREDSPSQHRHRSFTSTINLALRSWCLRHGPFEGDEHLIAVAELEAVSVDGVPVGRLEGGQVGRLLGRDLRDAGHQRGADRSERDLVAVGRVAPEVVVAAGDAGDLILLERGGDGRPVGDGDGRPVDGELRGCPCRPVEVATSGHGESDQQHRTEGTEGDRSPLQPVVVVHVEPPGIATAVPPPSLASRDAEESVRCTHGCRPRGGRRSAIGGVDGRRPVVAS